jgi:hypothetical protein
MKIKSILFFVIFLFTTHIVVCGQTNLSTKISSAKLLDASPLTQEEIDTKNIIASYNKPINEQDYQNECILFYGFNQYDNILSLRIINYLIKHPQIKKVNFTKDAFAIVVTNDFDQLLLEKNIKNTGLNCKGISKEIYLNSLIKLNNK